jgi:hypothetical protein
MSLLDAPLPPRLAERTPLDWRDLLIARLDASAPKVAEYEAYYDGEHPLQFATSKYREAFGNLFAAFADNWCQIVVDSSVERLRIVGFEVGGSPSDEAWQLWQTNALDVESVIAHTEAGKSGSAYLLVDPNGGEPRITIEHASQVAVASDPGDRRRRIAALKRWLGDDGYLYCTLYLPDVVLKFESAKPAAERVGLAPLEWVPRLGEPDATPNPLGVVPIIPLENKPGLLGGGHSDLEPAIPLQNAVNKLCSDLIITSEYGAYPQRVATGIEVPKDPETGQPIVGRDELKAAMSRMMILEPADARVNSLPAADLSNFTTAVEMLVQHLAAQTRTPPHYLLARLVNTSGDALTVAEAGLVSKCRAKILFFSDPWEEAIALALQATGADTTVAECEAMWANPERIAEGARVDAAVKKKTLGIPLPEIWLELGYTPEKIAEMEALEKSKAQAALEQAAAAEAAAARATERFAETGPPAAPTPGAPPPAAPQPPPTPPPTK